MPKRTKAKSFNGSGCKGAVLRLLAVTAAAAAAMLLVVPQAFQHCVVPFMQAAAHPLRAFGFRASFPDVDPTWS